MKNPASPSRSGSWSLAYASLCAPITSNWAGVSSFGRHSSHGVVDTEGACHLALMVVVLRCLVGRRRLWTTTSREHRRPTRHSRSWLLPISIVSQRTAGICTRFRAISFRFLSTHCKSGFSRIDYKGHAQTTIQHHTIYEGGCQSGSLLAFLEVHDPKASLRRTLFPQRASHGYNMLV